MRLRCKQPSPDQEFRDIGESHRASAGCGQFVLKSPQPLPMAIFDIVKLALGLEIAGIRCLAGQERLGFGVIGPMAIVVSKLVVERPIGDRQRLDQSQRPISGNGVGGCSKGRL